VTCPFLWCPTGSDGDETKKGGALYEIMNGNLENDFLYHHYDKMVHGFFTRGDIDAEGVKGAMTHGYKLFTAALKKYLA